MFFLPPFQEKEMTFLEESVLVGIFPYRADGPVTDLVREGMAAA